MPVFEDPPEARVPQISALPRRLSSRMAAELHDMILDHLRGSKTDLDNCSTVCKSWLPRCRYHLFAEVVYHPNLIRFLEDTTHANTSITPYIRKVHVVGPLPNQELKHELGCDPILDLQFKQLANLHLKKIDWEDLPSQVPSSFMATISSSFKRLTKMTLDYVHFPSFSSFAEVLDEALCLQELYLDSISWDDLGSTAVEKDGGRIPRPYAEKLTGLYISFCHTRVILNWLHYGVVSGSPCNDHPRPSQNYPLLTTVSLSNLHSNEASTVGPFISSLSSSLKHVMLGFQDVGDSRSHDEIVEWIDFSGNQNLKTVSILDITLFQFPFRTTSIAVGTSQPTTITAHTPYAWIPQFLLTVPLDNFHKLTLHIWLSAESQLNLLDWSRLRECLSLTVSISIIVSGIGRDTDIVEAWFRSRLDILDPLNTLVDFTFKD